MADGKEGKEGKQADDRKPVTQGALRKALLAVVNTANDKFALQLLAEQHTALEAKMERILAAVERLSTNVEVLCMKEREMAWKAKLAPKGSLAVPLRRHMQVALAEGKWTEYNMTIDERESLARNMQVCEMHPSRGWC